MRYILMRCKGEPPAVKACGMKDIVGMRVYKTASAAMADLRPDSVHAAAYLKEGFTHYGLYQSPQGNYKDPDPLVKSEKIKEN